MCESTINLPPEGKGEVKHTVKPQTKTAKKSENNDKNIETTVSVSKEIENRYVIEKKSVPTRTNVKKLTPMGKNGVKK
jgi:RNA 3'-terminal phosphate cyclase